MRFKFQSPITTTTARNISRPSSYESQGIAPRPDTGALAETGSARGTQFFERVPALSTPYQRAQIYNQMMTDAAVDVSVRVWKTPVLGSEMFVDPYSDDPEDQDIATFIWHNLAGGMSAPLINTMVDILHFCEDGYSVLEKVYENRNWSAPGKGRNTKQYVMLKKLGVRPVLTIQDISYDDNGGPKEIIQNAIQGDGNVKEVTLDISKLIIFTLNRKGGDVTGKSVLRTAYQHWYYKNHMYKIDAIQKERHGIGVPRGKLLPGYTADDKTVLRTLLRNLRTNEEAFIMQTPNVEIDFAELTGQPVDVMKSAEHHNIMILLNVMAQFMALGIGVTSSGGGRATGGTQSDMFMKALRYIAEYICDMINMYLIPELVVWNFNTTNFPKLRVRNIGETRDLQMHSAALSNLLSQGGLTMDLATEQWIRRTYDMPAKQANAVNYDDVAPANTIVTNGNGDTPVPGSTNGRPQKGSVKVTTGTGNVGKPNNAPE